MDRNGEDFSPWVSVAGMELREIKLIPFEEHSHLKPGFPGETHWNWDQKPEIQMTRSTVDQVMITRYYKKCSMELWASQEFQDRRNCPRCESEKPPLKQTPVSLEPISWPENDELIQWIMIH